jgi:hypothetical protein
MKANYLFNRFIFFKNKIIDKNLTFKFRMIFFSRITVNSTTQLMGLFVPIFLYQFLDFNLTFVIIYYLIADLLFANLISLSCIHLMNRLKIRKSIQLSVFFGAAFYLTLFILDRFVLNDLYLFDLQKAWFLVPALFFTLLFRLSHWVPYHTHMAKLTQKNIRAKQLSLMEATMMALGAIMPIVGGLTVQYLGYSVLFTLAIGIYFLALIPLFHLPKIKETFTWTYRQTWRVFFSKKRRSLVIAYAGDGAENFVGTVIWPIFIWQLLEGNYFQVGAISSIIVLVTIILQILIGDKIDSLPNKRKWLKYGTLFYSFGWILKALIGSAFQVFLFSTYHNLSRVFSRTSFDALNYDISADQGHFVDEYTVIREKSIMLGRIIMALIVMVLIPFVSLKHLFLLAALASLLMTFLKESEILNQNN